LLGAKENYLGMNDEFTAQQGFKISVSLDKQGPEMPPEVGRIEIHEWSWSLDAEGKFVPKRGPLPYYNCSEDNKDSDFFPVAHGHH